MHVEGDGNCFWRSVAMAIWGTDEKWCQLKLMVLGWATAHADSLVGEGGVLHKCGKYYAERFHEEYVFRNAVGVHCPDRDNYKMMLLGSIEHFCEDGVWGGDLTALLVAQALRVPVKFLSPADMKSRVQYDTQGREPPHGIGKQGLQLDDHRHSRSFVPHCSRLKLRVRGVDGKNGVVREEIVVALSSCSKKGVCESALADIPEVDGDTEVNALSHFSAIMSKNGSTAPFPLYKVAPPLFSVQVSV